MAMAAWSWNVRPIPLYIHIYIYYIINYLCPASCHICYHSRAQQIAWVELGTTIQPHVDQHQPGIMDVQNNHVWKEAFVGGCCANLLALHAAESYPTATLPPAATWEVTGLMPSCIGIMTWEWMICEADTCLNFLSQVNIETCSTLFLVGGFNPSEQYESQLGWLFPTYMESHKIHVSNHQPGLKHLRQAMTGYDIWCFISWPQLWGVAKQLCYLDGDVRLRARFPAHIVCRAKWPCHTRP